KNTFSDAQFLFVGAKDKMEMQKVPQAGYEIKGLWISGIQRKISIDNALFPFKLLSSLYNSFKIIKKFKPDVVIGTGGFASGAILKVASFLGIPTLIQEQNSYPGITNKLLSKKANTICVAYENLERYFPKEKLKLTGNPVRQDLIEAANKTEALTYFNLEVNKKTILILGGSLGARRINQLVEKELDFLLSQNIQIIWQCGKLYFDEYKKYSSQVEQNGQKSLVTVMPFIDRMDLVYAAADIIVSRSGASSVSELCIIGKPTIFIPSPNVAEDHQTKNAKAIADKNGAILLKESDLNSDFQTVFKNLLEHPEQQILLGQNIKKLALPHATKDIVKEIEKLIVQKGKH
ncbi:MAG TPA: undecaprenyldiphospho-muramoylpentapeptide beta-N-acetylglucosaminyltransferase, partial [Flavobacterium sp.]|nr:undecaprenyldiphospho-muramoylpentapeptide beta-N-acetylglucosaminyltransferase [Flavobacterium sp.]